MELFNKYKNKNFAFLTNYINKCINDNSLALTPEQIRIALAGTSQSTFEEFLLALTNSTNSTDDYDAMLLYNSNGAMLPIRQTLVPVRATIAEKAWLYYILEDSKSDLFINSDLKERLIHTLENDISTSAYPIKKDYIDIRELSPENNINITHDYVERFKAIVTAIRSHKYLIVSNQSFEGKTYNSQKVIPYKLEYSSQFDSFSLSCYPLDVKRPVKMNLKNLSKAEIGEIIPDYDSFLVEFDKQLATTKEKEPISIEITNKVEAYDRCAYLFSSYNTFCYDLGDDKLQMNIYYYRFQKDEVLRNILFLGPYIKVLSPKCIADELIEIIKTSYKNCQ